jgi:hypothetical protein
MTAQEETLEAYRKFSASCSWRAGADGKERRLIRGAVVVPQRIGLDQRVQRRAGREGESGHRLLDEARFAVPHHRLEQAAEASGQWRLELEGPQMAIGCQCECF